MMKAFTKNVITFNLGHRLPIIIPARYFTD